MMVDVDWVTLKVDYVRQVAGDDEAAHGAEDRLFHGLLEAIAKGRCYDPQACAAEALKSLDIEFTRWMI